MMSKRINHRDKNLLAVKVIALDAELEFTLARVASGNDLFDLVCRAIGLRETWYFGLQYRDTKGFISWIKLQKPLVKQDIAPDGFLVCSLLARFYPEDVLEELIQEITQHLFFLQVRHSILENHIHCHPEEAMLLASFDAQVKLGDFDDINIEPSGFPVEDLLPKNLMQHYPEWPREAWENRIRHWHGDHRGLSRNEAEMEYLKVAQNLEMFGVSYFEIANKKESELYLGVTPFGLYIYEKHDRRKPKISFPWSEIKNVSYESTKFIIRLIDKKLPYFAFYSSNLKLNKIILDLCMGNHDLYLRRRKPDSIEVQQMKLQAKDEKARRHAERQKLLREKILRDELMMEKQELQRQLLQMQNQIQLANDEVRRSQETVDVLATKAQISQEEAVLLNRKAIEAEKEIQQLRLTVIQTKEENLFMEDKVREAEMMALQMVTEAEHRTMEANRLKEEVIKARAMERRARDRLLEIIQPPAYHHPDIAPSRLSSQAGDWENGNTVASETTDRREFASIENLSIEIERERLDCLEINQHLQEQFNNLRSELQSIKSIDTVSGFIPFDLSAVRKEKYVTLQKAGAGNTKDRIDNFEKL